jgi:exopolysaccharide biosynthesis protein
MANEKASQEVLRRSQARIPARSAATPRLSSATLAIVVAVIGIAAAIVGFVVRGPLERAIVLGYARSATGLRIDASAVERIDGGYAFRDFTASTPEGAAGVSASRAEVVVNDHAATIVLRSARFAFAPERVRGDEARRTLDAMSKSGFGTASLAFSVLDGTAVVVAGAVPEPILEFENVSGHLATVANNLTWDGTAQLIDGDARYLLSGRSVPAAGGGPAANTLSAAQIPLEALAPLLPAGGPFAVKSGSLFDLEIADGATLHATARVEDVDALVGSHEVRGVHGPLTFADDGVGSAGLAGTIDGVPFQASGEVHDLGPHFGFLRDGSNDLTNLANLAAMLASEPRVRSVQVEADAPGLAFGQYAMTGDHGPLAVSVLAIDPKEPTLRFDTAIAEDHIISGGERTSAMGVRTGAVAGVNGDYFDIGRTYQPQGMLVRKGELIRGPVNRAALAIDKNNHVTFGEFQLTGTARVNGQSFPVTQVNDWPAGNVTVITPSFGKVLPPDPGTTFARLEPVGASTSRYRITSVEAATSELPVSFGLAFGPKVDAKLRAGEIVDLRYGTDPPLADAVAAIGGGPILVRDGAAYEDPDAPAPDERNYRWPVIALAETNNGHLLLVAVDGRHPERSVGMMRPEFAELLLRMGARNAMALDSGGSVTLVSRAVGDANVSVRNVPSDNSAERWVSDALFLYSSAPPPTIVPVSAAPTPVPEVRPSP